MAPTTADSLSLGPQVAQATVETGSRSFPPPAGGGCLGACPFRCKYEQADILLLAETGPSDSCSRNQSPQPKLHPQGRKEGFALLSSPAFREPLTLH